MTLDVLSDIYYNLAKKYFGDNVEVDNEIRLEWSRIPHFYSSFYVYKYATGFSAATAISKDIIKYGNKSVEKYIEFLKTGDSLYPIDALKKAGVNLETSEPVERL